jgi:hypothetical protein
MLKMFRPLIKPLVLISLVIAAIVFAFMMVLWLIPRVYFYGGMVLFVYALAFNHKRLLVGASVGYGLSLSGLLVGKSISRIFHTNAQYVWHARDAADVAAYTVFSTQHHQAGTLATSIVLVAMVLGAAFAVGAARFRIPSKVDGKYIVDPNTIVNRLLTVPWTFFPYARELDAWCETGSDLAMPSTGYQSRRKAPKPS